jgi:hypothetical protein
MFFVIDFETSALNPWDGFPLTVGIVPVNHFGDIIAESAHLYVEFPIRQEPDWHMPANLTETEQFWLSLKNSEIESDNIAFESAWYRDNGDIIWGDCMSQIEEFFAYIEPDPKKRFLCANPIAFDKMWMDYQFSDWSRENPYHYRSLCLRSMRYGLQYGENPEFGSSREDHEPVIPHHALHDARAEAQDLKQLMNWSRADFDFKVMSEPETADDV